MSTFHIKMAPAYELPKPPRWQFALFVAIGAASVFTFVLVAL